MCSAAKRAPRHKLDLRCYLITASGTFDEVIATATQAARGGAGIIQVRSKPISARDLFELSRRLSRAVYEENPATHVVIDDRADVAAALMRAGENVHGVHVGQDDLPVTAVREFLGPDAIIGLTTGTLELVRAVEQVSDIVDYIGCGPFRATPTKDSGRAPIGLKGYPALVDASPVPLVAIGDVTAADAPALAAAGVDGVAVVRGFAHSDDPAAYAREILEAF